MLIFAIIAVNILIFAGSAQAAVSTCYKCTDCTLPCDGTSCTSTQTCTGTTGTDFCFV